MIELYYILLGCTLIVLLLAWTAAIKWWNKIDARPLKQGDFVVAPPRTDIVYEVLSHPRRGFVAIRRRGRTALDDPWPQHPILVVDPSNLKRVRA